MKLLKLLLSTLMIAVVAPCALAQTPWPSKPIRFLVPYGAGGATDQLARVIGDAISKDLGQADVIENKPGTSVMIGGAACKSAVPDGYTFCLFIHDVVTLNPAVFKKVPYKPETDFVPVAYVAEVGSVLAVPGSLPVTNIQELVTYAKAHPATTNWASYGNDTSSHLPLELLDSRLGASITHMPYQTSRRC